MLRLPDFIVLRVQLGHPQNVSLYPMERGESGKGLDKPVMLSGVSRELRSGFGQRRQREH